MKFLKSWWLWLILFLLLSGFFLKTGLSVTTEMELNCSKYDVQVCRCGGLIYDFGKECLGVRYSCEMYLDGCVTDPPIMLEGKEVYEACVGNCLVRSDYSANLDCFVDCANRTDYDLSEEECLLGCNELVQDRDGEELCLEKCSLD